MTSEDLSAIESLIRRVIREELAASKRRKKPDDFVGASELEAAGVNPRHAAEWLAIRKAKNLPLTLTAWEQTQEEAKKAGVTVAEAIRISCGMAWAGFRSSWMDKVAPEVKPVSRPSGADWIKQREAIEAEIDPAKRAELARMAREQFGLKRVV